MTSQLRGFRLISAALLVLLIGSVVLGAWQMEQDQRLREEMQARLDSQAAQLEALQKERTQLQAQLNDAQAKITSLQGNITAQQKDMDGLKSRLAMWCKGITAASDIKVVERDVGSLPWNPAVTHGKTVSVVSWTRGTPGGHDLVTVYFELRNDGGPGTATVRISWSTGIDGAHGFLENAYFLPQNTKTGFTETMLIPGSGDVNGFDATVMEQISAC